MLLLGNGAEVRILFDGREKGTRGKSVFKSPRENLGVPTEDFGVVPKIWESLRNTLASLRNFWGRYGALWRLCENLGAVTENFGVVQKILESLRKTFGIVQKILASLRKTLASFRKFGNRYGRLLASFRKFWRRCGKL
jgi:hypothetical protein